MRDGAADDDLHVATACPLDCPDACSLTVSVRDGRIVEVDGGHASDVTRGYICAKVRRFPERVYGPDRVRYPMVRTGRKGSGEFARVSWDEALEKIASEITRVRETISPEAILPFCYGGSNGLLTQDAVDMVFFRRLGASRLLRTVCAAPTSAANQALYGKMPSVVYRDYPETKLLILWGVNPGVSGIHAIPYIRAAQKNGAKLVVIDPRTTPQARVADLHLAIKPGTDVVVALAVHRYLFENGYADQAFLDAHTTGAELLRTKAAEWTFERAAEVAGVAVADLLQLAHWYAGSSPALVRCGWGLERNRNGGNASLAVLALPAVGGKFGVRGGGYAMSNSAAWGLTRPWLDAPEPPTRAINMNQLGEVLTEPPSPPVSLLFVYNCNPAATIPDQARVLRGLERDDLFTVVFEQVLTDTVPYADVVLPATTFLEHYDFSKAYGPITMQLTQPVVEPIGEARSNADVFNDLGRRLDLFDEEGGRGELDSLLRVLNDLPAEVGSDLKATGVARP
ncbi:MAG TPA: molybdopterin-dependent oxidoreductase, partial [Vicinamibacterales bacterium]|nr:molybdopterin-dependent oxidoreductase [Vicinamibacterales bacterium]